MDNDTIRKYKQVILIRQDLGMDCGKKCVQVAHASLMGYHASHDAAVAAAWCRNGMRKIVLKVPNKEMLEHIVETARMVGINGEIVRDAGLTQLEPDTVTCAGFMPLYEESIAGRRMNELTKDLKLL
jgi:PTH2 family peptidyl-tRNA hydrolase